MTRNWLLPAAVLIMPGSIMAQRAHEVRTMIDSVEVRVEYDGATEPDAARVLAHISGRRAWPLGGKTGAVLFVGASCRLGTTIVASGRYAMALQRDEFGTWLTLRPLRADESPIRGGATLRIPLEEETTDSAAPDLSIAFERVPGTSETIVFGYDSAARREINRYSLHTESNRGLTRLMIAWGDRRWGAPVMGIGRVEFTPQ